MVGQDSGVNVPGLLLVKGPHPRFAVVSADDDGQRCAVDIGRFAEPRQPVLALYGDQMNRLAVRGGGGNMSRLLSSRQMKKIRPRGFGSRKQGEPETYPRPRPRKGR